MINTDSQKWLYFKIGYFNDDKPAWFTEWIINITKEDLLYILWENYETSPNLKNELVAYQINWKTITIPNENLTIVKDNFSKANETMYKEWDISERVMEILYSDEKVLKFYLKDMNWPLICINYEIFTIN